MTQFMITTTTLLTYLVLTLFTYLPTYVVVDFISQETFMNEFLVVVVVVILQLFGAINNTRNSNKHACT